MARRVELESITFKCGDTSVTVPKSEAHFLASESECEMCGSHGEITIDVYDCPNCKKNHEIAIKEW